MHWLKNPVNRTYLLLIFYFIVDYFLLTEDAYFTCVVFRTIMWIFFYNLINSLVSSDLETWIIYIILVIHLIMLTLTLVVSYLILLTICYGLWNSLY